MLRYTVEDMTCGHCVGTITQAIRAVAPNAHVHVDLGAKEVAVEGPADGAAVLGAIREAGYSPVEGTAPVRQAAKSGCCGGRR
jgi:copper chaperone